MFMTLALLLFPAQELPPSRPDRPVKTEIAAKDDATAATNKDSESAMPRTKDAELSPKGASPREAKEANNALDGNAETLSSHADPVPMATVSPLWAMRREQRTPKMWWVLVGAGHSAAAFDSYSTRRAIQNGSGRELNPLMKPFASSNALYFATQAQPALLDYVGLRLRHSSKSWVRRLWWVPQVAGTAASVWVGTRNMRIGNRTTSQLP